MSRKKARMKAPFFTVLIDTYNYGEFIEEPVSSVRQNSGKL